MNPSTLLRIWQAWFRVNTSTELHTLRIGAESGCWPGTIYRAVELGYLRRVRRGWFVPTDRLSDRVREIMRSTP